MGKNDDLAEEIIRSYARARVADEIVFMSYGDLAMWLDRPGQQNLLGDPLDRVRKLCKERALPDVATVIVDKRSLNSGKLQPSPKALEKYGGWKNLRKEQARVIAFDWSLVS